MPQTADQHGCHGRHNQGEEMVAAGETFHQGTGNGEEEVIAQPGGKADVPAVPELGEVAGEIRQVKVAWSIQCQTTG